MTSKQASEEIALTRLLDCWGVKYSVFAEQNFMAEIALKLGATNCICVRNEIDFYFKSGRYIGSSTQNAKSWVKRKKARRS